MQDEYSRMQRSAMAAGSPTAVKDGWESVKDAGQRVKGEEGQAKPPPPHEEGPQLCPEGSNPFSVSPLTTPCANPGRYRRAAERDQRHFELGPRAKRAILKATQESGCSREEQDENVRSLMEVCPNQTTICAFISADTCLSTFAVPTSPLMTIRGTGRCFRSSTSMRMAPWTVRMSRGPLASSRWRRT